MNSHRDIQFCELEGKTENEKKTVKVVSRKFNGKKQRTMKLSDGQRTNLVPKIAHINCDAVVHRLTDADNAFVRDDVSKENCWMDHHCGKRAFL